MADPSKINYVVSQMVAGANPGWFIVDERYYQRSGDPWWRWCSIINVAAPVTHEMLGTYLPQVFTDKEAQTLVSELAATSGAGTNWTVVQAIP